MRKLAFFVAFFAALPLAAQQPAPPPPGGDQPKLEAPKMAEPEPEAAKPKHAAVDEKPKATPADANGGKVVEEIIARVNNEIITKSEYDKALASAEDDAKQECENRCTPEQLQKMTEDRKKS